jgi:hypothetical protein
MNLNSLVALTTVKETSPAEAERPELSVQVTSKMCIPAGLVTAMSSFVRSNNPGG